MPFARADRNAFAQEEKVAFDIAENATSYAMCLHVFGLNLLFTVHITYRKLSNSAIKKPNCDDEILSENNYH